jgi:glucose/arabinose dehydrogenase
LALIGLALSIGSGASPVVAQTGPTVVDPDLGVRTVVSGLTTPSTVAFLGPNDFLVLEKNTGRVKRVVDGTVQAVVLDLAVNFASERGLLGIALHPDFPADPGVYLFWS